ncbi:MAG: isoprenylcysteine carboxylmethyltransferase family protein [Candidatus Bathyarchaeota archaeon]|nr:isoprenylcysteine carboxylmethyltransferase family protein [Candidatus Bathyarchaeota archaeon]
MTRSKVDMPSLFMALSFTSNLAVCFFDPIKVMGFREVGVAVLVSGGLIFAYVLFYLKSGFFGETQPKLDFLITKGPYRFCRHPQYLSFVMMILSIDLMFGSVIGIVFTVVLSIPSAVYRARIEDRLLRDKFGEEWDNYASKVGFFFPRFRGKRKNN